MSKLEKSVTADIRRVLEHLESVGCILWHERLNSGKVRTEYGGYVQLCRMGTPDYIVALRTTMGLLILFIEAKSDTGKQSIQQVEFQRKHQTWAIYMVAKDVLSVKNKIESLTNFYRDKLASIDL